MNECAECGATINIESNAEPGEIISCQECGTDLELRSVNPVVLERAPEEEEDWGE